MLVLRCLFRPAAAAWLLCSMSTVQADEGVARVADLRPTTGVASTTALRAARQDAAATAPAKPESNAEDCCGEDCCGEGEGCCKCTAEGCGECCCDGEGCGECGCKGEGCNGGAKSGGLLSRWFGGHGTAGKKGSSRHGNGHGGSHVGQSGGIGGHAGSGAGSHGANLGHGANGGHGVHAQGGNGTQHGGSGAHHGTGNGLNGGGQGNSAGNGVHGLAGGSQSPIYHPSSPHQWFGGNGHGTCPSCHCNPCRCGNGYGANGQVDYGDKIFSCLFGWAFPSGACGQGLPLVGKYHMVYADQPGYVNPADTQLYSAQGYGMPMTVPLAPTVNYQYNYSSGLPASRITTIGTWNPMTSPTALPCQTW
jgi:hypothetical protein